MILTFPWKASRSNPCLHFPNCTQNDVTMARCGWTSFRGKNNCILLILISSFLIIKLKWFATIFNGSIVDLFNAGTSLWRHQLVMFTYDNSFVSASNLPIKQCNVAKIMWQISEIFSYWRMSYFRISSYLTLRKRKA